MKEEIDMKKKLISPSTSPFIAIPALMDVLESLDYRALGAMWCNETKETNESPTQQRQGRKRKTGSRSNGNKRK